MMGMAMKYAVGNVKNKFDELFGYSLEIKKIYGSNNEYDVLNNVLQTFLERIPFFTGSYSPETSYEASILTGTF